MPSENEERSVTVAEAKAGVELLPGHAVVLIIDGAHGTRRPAASADDSADEARHQEAEEDLGPQPDAAHPLRRSRWGKPLHDSGEHAEMIVEAHASVEGRDVELTVERREGATGSWALVTRVQARVQGGRVRATAQVAHPGADKGRTHYRFKTKLA